MRYKTEAIENHRLKREKSNSESPLVAGRLLLDTPQAFDSIREDLPNAKCNAKSSQINGILI